MIWDYTQKNNTALNGKSLNMQCDMGYLLKIFIGFILVFPFLGFTEIGKQIDELNGVPVYYNGKLGNVHGRHYATDGYNLGLKWQCVEFVKRYYYEFYNHVFPNSYGHAKDFYDSHLKHNSYNKHRDLLQFQNAHNVAPCVGDIVVFGPSEKNPFGHVAIIADINATTAELIQQNCNLKTRFKIPYVVYSDYHTLANEYILGWLRVE